MIKFGSSGFCYGFMKKHKSSSEMPTWLKRHKLSCHEMSFTNGVRITNETCEKFGKLFKKANIELSVHAPYFINFASPNPIAIEKSNMYIIASLQKMKYLGAKKLVFHVGTLLGKPRDEAFSRTYENIKNLLSILDEYDFGEYYLCPETMGKHGQIGTIEEIAKICALDERLMPTIDFGHINAFGGGCLKSEEDYENVFETLKKYLGDRFNKIHIHFSKIQYGAKGEIRHLTFKDNIYGPEFEPLAKVLKKYNVEACVISESSGTQTKDAVAMQKIYNNLN